MTKLTRRLNQAFLTSSQPCEARMKNCPSFFIINTSIIYILSPPLVKRVDIRILKSETKMHNNVAFSYERKYRGSIVAFLFILGIVV